MKSSTEVLRELLDERGVEYDKAATVIGETVATFWHDRDGYPCSAIEGADDIPDGEVSVQMCITPAQAIAATLGDVPSLPHFWTHDGTLHIELPKLPESISVRLPDQRDREVRSARVWQYTLGAGTCREVYLVETSDDLLESWFPLAVYLHREAAEDCAEALRKENDGIQQFARVSELKVVGA